MRPLGLEGESTIVQSEAAKESEASPDQEHGGAAKSRVHILRQH